MQAGHILPPLHANPHTHASLPHDMQIHRQLNAARACRGVDVASLIAISFAPKHLENYELKSESVTSISAETGGTKFW